MGVYEAWDVEAVVANCQEEVENFAIDARANQTYIYGRILKLRHTLDL